MPDGRVRASLLIDGKKYLGVGFNSEIALYEAVKHVLLEDRGVHVLPKKEIP